MACGWFFGYIHIWLLHRKYRTRVCWEMWNFSLFFLEATCAAKIKNHFWWISITWGLNKYQNISSAHKHFQVNHCFASESKSSKERILIFPAPSIKVYQVKFNRAKSFRTRNCLPCSHFFHKFSLNVSTFLSGSFLLRRARRNHYRYISYRLLRRIMCSGKLKWEGKIQL